VYIYLHIHTLCKSHTCIYPHICTLCIPNIRVFIYTAYIYVYNCRERESASVCFYAWIYIHICTSTLMYITKVASENLSVFLCMYICIYIGGYFYHCRLLRCHLWLLGDSGLKDAVRDCHSHRKGMAASVPLRFIIGLQRFIIGLWQPQSHERHENSCVVIVCIKWLHHFDGLRESEIIFSHIVT